MLRNTQPVPSRARIPSLVCMSTNSVLLPWSLLSRALPLTPKAIVLGMGRPGWVKSHTGSLRASAVGG